MWIEFQSTDITAVLIIAILITYWNDVSYAHICLKVLDLSFDRSVALWYVRDFGSLIPLELPYRIVVPLSVYPHFYRVDLVLCQKLDWNSPHRTRNSRH